MALSIRARALDLMPNGAAFSPHSHRDGAAFSSQRAPRWKTDYRTPDDRTTDQDIDDATAAWVLDDEDDDPGDTQHATVKGVTPRST
jgi:hypothetical protein